MDLIKRNITLVFGISIPILMILLVAGSIYLPGIFIKPHFNFIYTDGNYYYGQYEYSVQNGRLIRNELKQPEKTAYYQPPEETKLYFYDVTKNESKEISFEEAQTLNLDTSLKSPDGFEVVYGSRSGGFFPFFGGVSDYNTQYLKGHNVSTKLNLQLNTRGYNSFRFLGWIK